MAALASDGKTLFLRGVSTEAAEKQAGAAEEQPAGGPSSHAPGRARKAPPPTTDIDDDDDDDDDETQAVIVDNGSFTIKAGLADEEAPRAVGVSPCLPACFRPCATGSILRHSSVPITTLLLSAMLLGLSLRREPPQGPLIWERRRCR